MAHCVRDAALLNTIIHSEQPIAPETLPLNSLRFGVIRALGGENAAQRKVWHHALEKLRKAGATLIDLGLSILAEVKFQACLSLYEFQVAMNGWLALHPPTYTHCSLPANAWPNLLPCWNRCKSGTAGKPHSGLAVVAFSAL